MNFLNLYAYRRHILYLFLSLPDVLFSLSFVVSSLCQVYCYDSKIFLKDVDDLMPSFLSQCFQAL